MKIILYAAISADGFIAKINGYSEWVSDIDAEIFDKKIKEVGCIVLGRRTFDQFPDLYPVKGATNIVLTSDSDRKSDNKDLVFTNKSPKEIMELAKKLGHKEIMVVGGGKTNGTFLKSGLINEIFLTVHPLVFGAGIKVFENAEVFRNLKLLEAKQLKEGLVQLRYSFLSN